MIELVKYFIHIQVECWHFAQISCKSIDEIAVTFMHSIIGNNSYFSLSDMRVLAEDIRTIIILVWRFTPDIIAALMILFMSSYGTF